TGTSATSASLAASQRCRPSAASPPGAPPVAPEDSSPPPARPRLGAWRPGNALARIIHRRPRCGPPFAVPFSPLHPSPAPPPPPPAPRAPPVAAAAPVHGTPVGRNMPVTPPCKDYLTLTGRRPVVFRGGVRRRLCVGTPSYRQGSVVRRGPRPSGDGLLP